MTDAPKSIALVRGPGGTFALWNRNDHGPFDDKDAVPYVRADLAFRPDHAEAVAAARAMFAASDARDEAFEAGRYEDAAEFDADEERAINRLRAALAAIPRD